MDLQSSRHSAGVGTGGVRAYGLCSGLCSGPQHHLLNTKILPALPHRSEVSRKNGPAVRGCGVPGNPPKSSSPHQIRQPLVDGFHSESCKARGDLRGLTALGLEWARESWGWGLREGAQIISKGWRRAAPLWEPLRKWLFKFLIKVLQKAQAPRKGKVLVQNN